jgi:hypothetical protein
MFRAVTCPSSGELIVSIWHLVYVTLYRWPTGVQVWMRLVRPGWGGSILSVLPPQYTPISVYSHLSILPPQYTPTSVYSHLSILPLQYAPTSVYPHLSILPPQYAPTSVHSHLNPAEPFSSKPAHQTVIYIVTYTRCRIDTINSPDDGHTAARNM